MTGSFDIPRKLIIFVIVLPLAVLLGYLLTSPTDLKSLAIVGLVLGVLSVPILLRWHHPLLIFSWNAGITIFFLPGQPQLWMLMSVVSFGLVVLDRAMGKRPVLLNVPAITWPLAFLVLVVVVTAKLTGGIGLRSMGGGSYGGKNYVFILFAIMGCFALGSQPIPPERVVRYMAIFLLSGLTYVVGNLAYAAGPSFYWLFFLFPVDVAIHQIKADYLLGSENMVRLTGLSYAAVCAFGFMLMRYGLQGIFDLRKPWRLLGLVLIIAASLFGGFRSIVAIFGLSLVLQFFLEGLYRTRLVLVMGLCAVLGGALVIPLANKLPLTVQRCLSFLPLDLDPVARIDAQNSLEWRAEMWRVVSPEIPKYLFLGKGYAINPADLFLASEAVRRGQAKDYEPMIISGNYHNGPLTVLIPFGIFGALGLVWFLAAGGWVLYRNYRYGNPAARLVNTFLFAHFLMRVIMYVVVFGDFSTDIFLFTGLVGLSLGINGGVSRPADPAAVTAA